MNTTSHTTQPRIYVACLAAYNNGYLHGAWIDAHQSPDALANAVQDMLAASPMPDAEEYAIHDHEGLGSQVSEWTSLENVAAMAEFVAEHGALGEAVLAECGGRIDEAERMMCRYLGCFRSVADYAQELTEDTTEIPTALQYYIDYDAMARDMQLNGDIECLELGFEDMHLFARE